MLTLRSDCSQAVTKSQVRIREIGFEMSNAQNQVSLTNVGKKPYHHTQTQKSLQASQNQIMYASLASSSNHWCHSNSK